MDVTGESAWPSRSAVPGPVWVARKVCRHELPCVLAGAFGHHDAWLLVGAIVLLTVSRTARWANRAMARARLRRMRRA